MENLGLWDGALWAWVRAFELAPGQPATGSVLPDEGFRITGVLVLPPDGSEGIVPWSTSPGVMGVETPAYRVTGTVVSADVLQVNLGSGPKEVGTGLELSVQGEVLYASVSDRAVTVGTGSVVTVQGYFVHIDEYKVDEFPNSGHAWLIEEVQDLAGGDSLILVRRT
jgi:hypothetical protein